MGKESNRNSVIELIRIISVIGIVGLHIFGQIKSQLSMTNIFVEIFYCDIFAMAVPMFLLISGYYSVSFSVKKITSLHLMVWTYSILDLIIRFSVGDALGAKDIVRGVFPIISYRFWYFSCYFLLMIFAPIINSILDNISKRLFASMLLLWMLVVNTVSVLPVFGFVDDYLWKVFFYYCAGRYLGKYGLRLFVKTESYLYLGIALILASFCINSALTLFKGEAVTWLTSDSFITKEISAIFIFYYLTKRFLGSSIVNKVASYVPVVYLAESTVRFVIEKFFHYDAFFDSPFLIFVVLGMGLVVYVIVVAVESLRRLVARPLEDFYARSIERFGIIETFNSFLERV